MEVPQKVIHLLESDDFTVHRLDYIEFLAEEPDGAPLWRPLREVSCVLMSPWRGKRADGRSKRFVPLREFSHPWFEACLCPSRPRKPDQRDSPRFWPTNLDTLAIN